MLPDTIGSRKSKMAADKPEVVITRRCEDISAWSQRLRHCFRARPIPLHLCRNRQTT